MSRRIEWTLRATIVVPDDYVINGVDFYLGVCSYEDIEVLNEDSTWQEATDV